MAPQPLDHQTRRTEGSRLSRHELLKALTALGGAAAASSLLPERWSKPEIGAGVLPAHAQGTLVNLHTILRCDLDFSVQYSNGDMTLYWNSNVWIDPPDAGIPMEPILAIISDAAAPSKPLESPDAVITDVNGRAGVGIGLTVPANPSVIGGRVFWYFGNPSDGSDDCEAIDYLNEE